MPTSSTCAFCHKQFGEGRFEIVRYDKNNNAVSTIPLCSLICTVQFAYGACISAGFKVAFGVQSAYARIKTMLFGGGS